MRSVLRQCDMRVVILSLSNPAYYINISEELSLFRHHLSLTTLSAGRYRAVHKHSAQMDAHEHMNTKIKDCTHHTQKYMQTAHKHTSGHVFLAKTAATSVYSDKFNCPESPEAKPLLHCNCMTAQLSHVCQNQSTLSDTLKVDMMSSCKMKGLVPPCDHGYTKHGIKKSITKSVISSSN